MWWWRRWWRTAATVGEKRRQIPACSAGRPASAGKLRPTRFAGSLRQGSQCKRDDGAPRLRRRVGEVKKRAKVLNRKCFLDCLERVSFFGGASVVLNRNGMTGAPGAVLREAKCKGAQDRPPTAGRAACAAGGSPCAAGRPMARERNGGPFEPSAAGRPAAGRLSG
jgi:hypothetical protein